MKIKDKQNLCKTGVLLQYTLKITISAKLNQ